MNIQDWTNKISVSIAKVLSSWSFDNPHERILILGIDCHPWNGFINLSVLTEQEAIDSPFLKTTEEMASWKHYDFSSKYSSWNDTNQLSSHMKGDYASSSNIEDCANKYFMACVKSMKIDIVKKEISKLNTATTFAISVAHPDTSYEFYSE